MDLDLGNLLVHLRMDVNESKKELTRVKDVLTETNKRVDEFARNTQKTSSALSGLTRQALQLAAAYVSVRSVLQSMDRVKEIGSFAAQVGVGTRQLGELQYAAKLTGLAAGQFNYHLQIMTRNLAVAAEGNNNASEAIERLGLSTKDLLTKNPADAFKDIADAFSNIQSPAERAKVAMELFGRGGFSLIEMLSKGRKGLDETGREAVKLGVALEELAVKRVELAKESVVRMGSAFEGLTNKLVIGLAPSIVLLTGEITKIPGAFNEASSAASEFSSASLSAFDKALAGAVTLMQVMKSGFVEIKRLYDWGNEALAKQLSDAEVNSRAKELYRKYTGETEAFSEKFYPGGFGGGIGITPPKNPQLFEGLKARVRAGAEGPLASTVGKSSPDNDYFVNIPKMYEANLQKMADARKEMEVQAAKAAKVAIASAAAGGTGGDIEVKSISDKAKIAATDFRKLQEERVRSTAQMYDQIGTYDDNWLHAQISALEIDRTAYEDLGLSKVQIDEWWLSQNQKLLDIQTKGIEEAAEKQKKALQDQQQKAERIIQANAQLYQGLENVTGAYEAQRSLLDDQKRRYEEIGADVRAINAWYERQIELLDITVGKTGTWAEQIKAAAAELKIAAKEAGGPWYQFTKEIPSLLESGMMRMAQDMRNWTDAMKSMLKEIYFEAIRIAFIRPAANAMAGAFSTVGSAVIGGIARGWGGGASVTTPAGAHGGSGLIGHAEGGMMWTPHIAKVAENEPELITPLSKLGRMGGKVTVNVINESGTPLTVTKQQEYLLSDQRIVDVSVQAAQTNGRYRRAHAQVK